jgi:hypothetical protein
MRLDLLHKAYQLKAKGIPLEEAKEMILRVHYACGGEWSAEECFKVCHCFITRVEPAGEARQADNRIWAEGLLRGVKVCSVVAG